MSDDKDQPEQELKGIPDLRNQTNAAVEFSVKAEAFLNNPQYTPYYNAHCRNPMVKKIFQDLQNISEVAKNYLSHSKKNTLGN